MKATCDSPTANILHSKWKVFPLDEGWDKDAPTLTTLFSTVLEVPGRAKRQQRSTQTRKEKLKPSVFADGMRLHMENTKYSIKQLQVSSCHLWQCG